MIELYDFYYSADHAKIIEDTFNSPKTYFKGQEFTACIKHNSDYIPHFEDTIQIGIGTYDDVE